MIDAVLRDFRGWLTALPQVTGNSEDEKVHQGDGSPSPVPCPLAPPVDLFTIVGQFTALRHEVNLQTKAARAAVEQNAEVLQRLAVPQVDGEPEVIRPLLKALIDISDALALSLRQMEKFRDSVEPLLDDLAGGGEAPPESSSPGFFARLFGRVPVPPPGRDPRAEQAAERLRQLAAAAADGYALSLRRVERLLPDLELEPIPCAGEPFDPETMEVVEVVGDSDGPSGTVVEEVRPGYRWRGKLFRFAQVKVAR